MSYLAKFSHTAAALTALCMLSACGASAAQSTQTTAQALSASSEQPLTTEVFAMDTYMTLSAYGDTAQTALDAAASEITRLDTLLSISSDSGEIAALNTIGEADLSAETLSLLTEAIEMSTLTDDAFDCTILPVMEAWGFTTQNYTVPDTAVLQDLLTHVDASQIAIEGTHVSLPDAVSVDLGGIAKGYTSDKVMEVLADNGVTSGIISLGGNVQTLGVKPDGSAWRVAIQDPKDASGMLGVLTCAEEAVITSGGYQRYFEQDGKTYHHIIDPKTGYPAQNGLTSVTIVSPSGVLADGLSTSLFVMGTQQAVAFWQAHRDLFQAILMTEDGQLLVTEGLQERFSPVEQYPCTIIS